MGLFTPKHKHKDPRVRQAVVAKLTNEELLHDLVQNDPDWRVRAVAIKKISDQEILNRIAVNEKVYEVRKKAIRKVRNKDVLWKVITTDQADDLRIMAVKRLGRPEKLSALVIDPNQATSVRKAAVNSILDIEILKSLYEKVSDEKIKNHIKERIKPYI